ncbi:MAG: Obg family GTPase CgtA [Myxococcales bacterium]|nr:Obg family GTPase CgtA [Myxococcales bacterium]
MRFVDRVRILVRAGDGGDGHVGWRREKYVPKGGPAGGDGGRGGDVILVADDSLTTLLDLRYRQHYRAESGKPGRNKCQHGRSGEDLRVHVPVGTAVYLEGVGEVGERPPWAKERGPRSDDEGGLETIYVFDDEFEEDDGVELDEEVVPDEAVAEAADDAPEGDAEANASEVEAEAEAVEAEAEADDAESETGEAEAEADGAEAEAEAEDAGAEAEDADDADPEAVDLDDEDDEGPSIAEVRRRERESAEQIGDLVEEGQELIVAHGGRGGRGNVHFRSSTNRAPTYAEPGRSGEGYWLRLELKLLADVGIVGFPNVGKSTLIRRISRARPKVGAYPFTTLVPQLGVVSLPGERSMVVADIPGLIRGASEGRGLGLEFLRHLERTRVLLHLLAPDPEEGREPLADLDALEAELSAYGSMFEGRPRVVALNKIDTPEGEAMITRLRRRLRAQRIPLFPISAATGAGVPALLEAIYRRVALSREREAELRQSDQAANAS